jgi:hypothetical protein
MAYTHEDYHRDYGPGFPDFYTTPADPALCKNLAVEGATPCWHPHCDCQPTAPRKSWTARISFGARIFVAGTVGALIGATVRFLMTGSWF